MSRCQTARLFSFPRRILRQLLLPFHTRLRFRFGRQIQPPDEGEWSADRRTLLMCRACEARRSALAIRGPSRCNRDALSALHRGDFRPRTHAVVSGNGTPEPQRPPAPGRKRPGGRGPDLPRRGSRRRRGTPHLAPSAGRLRRRPLLSQDGESCTINSLRSQ